MGELLTLITKFFGMRGTCSIKRKSAKDKGVSLRRRKHGSHRRSPRQVDGGWREAEVESIAYPPEVMQIRSVRR